MRITNDDYFIYLHDVPSRDKSVMEVFHAATFLKGKNGWRIPLNHHSVSEIYKAHPELRDDPKLMKLGYEQQAKFAGRLAYRKVSVPVPPESRLRPYQYDDMLYLLGLDAAGIFNEPRTGKTPMSIELMKRLGLKRNLVVCPASLILNWEKEINEWWPEVEVHVVEGTFVKRYPVYEKDGVVIVSKDTWKRDSASKDNLKWDTAFIDEAHFLRNYDSAQAKAIFKIKAHRRYALTGTPTVNHPADSWGILHFLNPKAYPAYWQFCSRYFQVNESRFSAGLEVGYPKPEREKELKEIVGIASVQRKRAEVMSWLPQKQYKTIPCKMEGKQLKLYQEMKDFFTATDETVEVDTENIISQFMRLRQLCLDPRLLGFDVEGVKTKMLKDYLSNHREPIVIMSMFTSYLKLIKPDLEKLGLKVGMIHGEMSNKEKSESVASFQSGKIDCLLCNIISAGVGFTMDTSTSVLFLDRAWTPTENSQAEDRVCPTTEEKNHAHIVIDLECVKSVDSRVNAILRRKQSLTQYINEGGRDAIKRLMEG